jgi:hypothetical protein
MVPRDWLEDVRVECEKATTSLDGDSCAIMESHGLGHPKRA